MTKESEILYFMQEINLKELFQAMPELGKTWKKIKELNPSKKRKRKLFFDENGVGFYNKYCLSESDKRLLQQQIIKYKFPKALDRVSLLDFQNRFNEAQKLFDKNNRLITFFKHDIEQETNFLISHKMVYWASVNLNKANYKRYKRIKDQISEVVESGNAYFLTLTFKDQVLNETSAKTRRIYVSRVLKEISDKYIANKDFGGKKGREHYHAIIKSTETPMLAKWTTKYGFVSIKKVRTTETDAKRVAKYTAKLTYHAIKQTTKSERIIYSKKQ